MDIVSRVDGAMVREAPGRSGVPRPRAADMPRLIDAPSRTDTMVWGVNYLLALHDPTGVTLRALARTTGISTSSLMHHYGNREHIMRVAAHRTAKAREQRIWVELRDLGITAFLPQGAEEDMRDARVWLAWREVHRSDRARTSPSPKPATGSAAS
ncbi:TetR family transcriptional regulator [Nocardioides sp. InS609-2]|uniref:TetR family transcriptional regulator n=1 Tax=Nocardioides sp. InS609-2 TaxID=2760705 RepID=UPI0020C14AEF|nr:TetR family transcriptional regulator [Nocardioides sp. InS609-2]